MGQAVRQGKSLPFPTKNESKFVLMGSGKLLCDAARALIKRGFPRPIILTHPKQSHSRDLEIYGSPRYRMIYESIFEFAKRDGLEVYQCRDVNSDATIKYLKGKGVRIACSFGLRCLVKEEFISYFKNLVLNCHGTDLPKYRGGALGTWQILNDESNVYGLFHLIDNKFDSGNIVIKTSLPLNHRNAYPADWLAKTWQINLSAFEELLARIEEGETIRTVPQNLALGSYFPRLKTEIHGAINWNWSAREIERFIRAFGWPHTGAFSFIGKRKIRIARTRILTRGKVFHPFLIGLVFRKCSDGSIEITTRDAFLKIISLRIGHEEVSASSQVKVGERFYTPSEILDRAQSYRASY